MEDEFKLIKVNCSFCGKEVECPEDMFKKSEKHMCFECFQNMDNKEMPEDMSKVHIAIPTEKLDEIMPEAMVNVVVEEAFSEIWKERKERLRDMSKKELAEEMFGAGAYIAVNSMMQALKHEAERESRREGKATKKKIE